MRAVDKGNAFRSSCERGRGWRTELSSSSLSSRGTAARLDVCLHLPRRSCVQSLLWTTQRSMEAMLPKLTPRTRQAQIVAVQSREPERVLTLLCSEARVVQNTTTAPVCSPPPQPLARALPLQPATPWARPPPAHHRLQAPRALCRSYRGSTWAPVERARPLNRDCGPTAETCSGLLCLDVPDTVYKAQPRRTQPNGQPPNLPISTSCGSLLSVRVSSTRACVLPATAARRIEKALSGEKQAVPASRSCKTESDATPGQAWSSRPAHGLHVDGPPPGKCTSAFCPPPRALSRTFESRAPLTSTNRLIGCEVQSAPTTTCHAPSRLLSRGCLLELIPILPHQLDIEREIDREYDTFPATQG